MNLWTIIAIILFLVIRSVSRTKEQIRQNNRDKEDGAGTPQMQEMNRETLFAPKEAAAPKPAAAVRKTAPKKAVVPERPVLSESPEPPVQQPYADTEYKVAGEENDDFSWFADADDLRRAVVNSEVLSRKFDL
ncbi:MAG: hypothetical protein J1E02_07780 [Coprobacter sp.]|nr:hypothetical protein [Coprobacter sp.]